MNIIYFKQVLIVGLGGFVGSSLRFMVHGWTQRFVPAGVFPLGTLVVNVIGCFFLGLLGGLLAYRGILEPGHRLFLMIGVLGGFTTFSAFAFETLILIENAEALKAFANILLQVGLSLAAAYAGYIGARYMLIVLK